MQIDSFLLTEQGLKAKNAMYLNYMLEKLSIPDRQMENGRFVFICLGFPRFEADLPHAVLDQLKEFIRQELENVEHAKIDDYFENLHKNIS